MSAKKKQDSEASAKKRAALEQMGRDEGFEVVYSEDGEHWERKQKISHGSEAITAFVGADYNPRVMPDSEMRNLMQSLREFGFVQPVVARKQDKLILGGHQRIEARKRIAAEDKENIHNVRIPVVWLHDISDDRAKLLNVALNKIHGEWDFGKLGELFKTITEAPAHLSGFGQQEIDDILKLTSATAATPTTPDIDVDAELAQEARKFALEAETDADAALVREALVAYGMTSPANAGTALARMARAALTHVRCEEDLCA